jgi:hypothetical protein
MGLFDGALSQASDMFDQKVTPALNQLHNDLSGMRGSSDELDHSIDALQAAIQANTNMQRALLAQLRMANKLHPGK